MSLFTVAPLLRSAMYATAKELFEPDGVLVIAGPPEGGFNPDEMVQIQMVDADQDTASMGSMRSREEVLTIDVLVSCATGGGEEVDDLITTRGYEILGKLEHQVRVVDTTLGGIVRDCFLTRHTSTGAGPDDEVGGRFIDITATFTARARVRGS